MPDGDLKEPARRRLAEALEEVPLRSPAPGQARYSRLGRPGVGRGLLPGFGAGLAAGLLLAAGLGFWSTGSPNPEVWTSRASGGLRQIQDAVQAEESPSPTPSPSASATQAPTAAPPVLVPRTPAPRPTATPRPPTPEPTETPGGGGGSEDGDRLASPAPSPSPTPSHN